MKPVLDKTPEDVVSIVFNLTPIVGDESSKIAVTMSLRMLFRQGFPKEPPVVEILTSKGIDDDQMVDLRRELVEGMQVHCNEEVDSEEMTGIVFNVFEELREILSKYNDTLKGRCSVCLDAFAKSEQDLEEGKFTDRKDLVRID